MEKQGKSEAQGQEKKKGKNIVVCCDGTGAEYGRKSENTNVVKLFQHLDQDDDDRQISYYDPGVGTNSALANPLTSWVERQWMMASGRSIALNVQKAYKYLMDYYEPGDRIFLFGYSRGAHTVRELASLIRHCGLLTKGSDNLIPYAVKLWKRGKPNQTSGFKEAFSRQAECNPYFIGVWDTVAAVGWLAWRRYYQHRRPNPEIEFAYHALAVDENRWYFQVSDWDEVHIPKSQTENHAQTLEQVWFPGCHSDVGGYGGDPKITNIPLKWMLEKASSKGLKLKEGWDKDLDTDPRGEIRYPRRHVWRLVPQKKRTIPNWAKIHKSVDQRIECLGDNYRPSNVPPKEDRIKLEQHQGHFSRRRLLRQTSETSEDPPIL